MPDAPVAFVHEAELQLQDGTDPAAVGAAVTTSLCGHWKHEPPCRWPHNNRIDVSDVIASFRTLFVASATDEDEVRERIEQSLRQGADWVVLETRARPVSRRELQLSKRLAGVLAT
jgi:hypothetical protein